MERFLEILVAPSSEDFLYLFLKAFAILFSVLYLVYSIVITRQTQVMNDTFTTKNAGILQFISFIQIIFGLILVAASLFLI